ncbi:MAG: hypothetical protein QNJ64_14065 [Crocosphaera sp.]|nr:hypothetical protein [Crocosphaera sp.]
MTPDNDNNINPEPSQGFEVPIEAELGGDAFEMDETEKTAINSSSYTSTENYQEPDESLELLPQWFKQTVISLSTPWGLASLCLVLGANLTIVGLQLWEINQPPQPQLSTRKIPDSSSVSLSIPKSLNLARKSPNTVMVDALSTVSNPEPSPPAPPKRVQALPRSQTPTQTVVHINQPPSLTNAILPPSLQPQTSVNLTPLKVPQTPRKSQPESIPIANIPRPVSSMTIPPSPPSQKASLDQLQQQGNQTQLNLAPQSMSLPTINQESLSQDEQIRQTIQQQLQMGENHQGNLPLGFNHKTRLELQNQFNRQSPDLLPQQIQQIEQLQQTEMLNPNLQHNNLAN